MTNLERIVWLALLIYLTRPEPPSDVGKFRYLSIGAPGTASAITLQVGSNFAGINISDGSATKTIWIENGRVIDRSLPEDAPVIDAQIQQLQNIVVDHEKRIAK